MKICRICNNSNSNRNLLLHEKMYGLGTEFLYIKCDNCGCLQIAEYPENMEQFYPNDYYSFDASESDDTSINPVISYLRGERLNVHLNKKTLLGKILETLIGKAWLADPIGSHININSNSKILDVGCGHGLRMKQWRNSGFRYLTGIDPYIESDIHYSNGVSIYKSDLMNFEGEYDVIFSSHSLEHMPNQHDMIKNIHRLLKPNGYAVIALPIFSEALWNEYNENWVLLDPPRHFYIHSDESFKILAQTNNFNIITKTFQSTPLELIASEQYKQNISLVDDNSYFTNKNNSIFNEEELNSFGQKIKSLNNSGKSGNVRFYLQKRN